MTRMTLDAHLAPAPPQVRRCMLDDADRLEPGAAAVIGRFFAIVAARHEPMAAPSPQSFREAAGSESTFRTLLRALTAYAPTVSAAGALPVKVEWVARRPKPTMSSGIGSGRSDRAAPTDIGSWPSSWQACWRGVEAARIRPSSLRRYRASINRCAQLVSAGVATEELNFLTAFRLGEALKTDRRKGADAKGTPLRPYTVANYIEGLVVLGRHGGADPEALAGVRFVRDHLRDVADAGDKLKFARIAEIMQAGGFAFIADRVGQHRRDASSLPDHSAEKTRLLQMAALCAVSMNKPGRTGDVSRWRIGEELQRDVDGTWHLAWVQEKNARETEAGALWPEVCGILDELVLGGRPDRFIHMRYRELLGSNWLTFSDRTMASRWPSSLVNAAIGVPLHDLRTLAADCLRLHDPQTAVNVIRTHLGHGSEGAGNDYRAMSEGDAAARSWMQMRRTIAERG